MPRNSSILHHLGRGLFTLLAFLLLQAPACPDIDYGSDLKRDKVDAFPTYEETWCRKIKEESALKGKKIKFTSLYRTPADQAAACAEIPGCGKCCPGQCACPGRSNHQSKATADVSGLPGDVNSGCQKLLEICNEIKACGKNVGCEIGGYGAGTHHLAADEGVKNNAYNQCAFLKGAVSQGPTGSCKNEKKNDDKQSQQPSPPQSPPQPPPPSAAQQAKQADDLMQKVMNPEHAEYPTPLPKSKNPSNGESASESSSASKDPSLKIAPPAQNPTSQITRGAVGGKESGGPAFGDESKSNEFAPTALGKTGSSGKGFGSHDLAPGSSNGAGNSSPTTHASETNELIAPFSGAVGSRSGSGSGSGSIGESSSSETAAAIKEKMGELSKMMERDPASAENANEADSANGETLFERCHAAHVRSVLGGRVSTR